MAGGVDPDRFGNRQGFRDAANEAFRVMIPGVAQGLFTLLQHGVCTAVMDVIGGEHGDSTMAVLGVVPREERPAQGDGGVDTPATSPGEAGVVLQGLELGLGEGVVIADLGAAQRASDPEVGEQLRGAFAGHGTPRGRSAG